MSAPPPRYWPPATTSTSAGSGESDVSNAKTNTALQESDLKALVARAHNGDATALPALGGLFQNPDVVELAGNLARRAEEALVARYCGRDLLTREGLTHKLEALRAELAGAGPTPLERFRGRSAGKAAGTVPPSIGRARGGGKPSGVACDSGRYRQ